MSEIIKLSRSTVEKYLSCPRCCVLDKKYKICLLYTSDDSDDTPCLDLVGLRIIKKK